MAHPYSFRLHLPSPESTTVLGQCMASALQAGDVVLLNGTLGAGKSHLARAIIQARLGYAEEVPSPTFTLVQCYEAEDVEIWHADLYRLSHPDEVIELGLEEAFATAIVLVEWPERLGDLAPRDAIRVVLSAEGDGRAAEIAFCGRAGLASALEAFRA